MSFLLLFVKYFLTFHLVLFLLKLTVSAAPGIRLLYYSNLNNIIFKRYENIIKGKLRDIAIQVSNVNRVLFTNNSALRFIAHFYGIMFMWLLIS